MKKYSVNKSFITQKIGEKKSIFDTENSFLYTLNETATYVFDKLRLGWNEEKIKEALIKKYDVADKQATKDILEIIEEFKKKKIISSK